MDAIPKGNKNTRKHANKPIKNSGSVSGFLKVTMITVCNHFIKDSELACTSPS